MSDASTFSPTPATPSSAPAERRGCDKLLVGCGLGCGVLILTFGILAVIGGLWFTRPGTQHETTSVVSPEGVAVMKLRDIGEDPGTQEFLTNLLFTLNEASRKQQREDMPENLRWLVDLQGNNASPAGLNMFFPKDLTLSLERRDPAELAAMDDVTEGDEIAVVAAINFRSFVRPIRTVIEWGARQDASQPIRYHGEHELIPFDEESGTWACFVDGTFLVSNSLAALEASLDRLDRGTVERAWSGEVPTGDWDFFGVVEEDAGLVDVLLREVAERNRKELERSGEIEISEESEVAGTLPAPPSDAILQMAFGVDLRSADALDARVDYLMESPEAAALYAEHLERELDHLRQRGEAKGLTVDLGVEQNVDRIEVSFAVTGLEEKVAEIGGWIVTVDEPADEPVDEPVDEPGDEAGDEAERDDTDQATPADDSTN